MTSATHSFSTQLAVDLGSVDLALIINHFLHWISVNKNKNTNFKEGRTWTFDTIESIASNFPYYKPHQVKYFINVLVERGILIKGEFNKANFDQTRWYAFKDESAWQFSKSNYGGENSPMGKRKFSNGKEKILHTIPESKPHSLNPVSLELGLQTEACDINRLETLDIAKRWRLNDDQMDTFNWLKGKGIDAEDKKLAFWAKTHPLQRLIDVFNESVHNGARSLRKYMSNLLDGKKIVLNSRIQANAEFAIDFAKTNGWGALKVFKKYLTFYMGKSKQEISLDLDTQQFVNTLLVKYELCQRQT